MIAFLMRPIYWLHTLKSAITFMALSAEQRQKLIREAEARLSPPQASTPKPPPPPQFSVEMLPASQSQLELVRFPNGLDYLVAVPTIEPRSPSPKSNKRQRKAKVSCPAGGFCLPYTSASQAAVPQRTLVFATELPYVCPYRGQSHRLRT